LFYNTQRVDALVLITSPKASDLSSTQQARRSVGPTSRLLWNPQQIEIMEFELYAGNGYIHQRHFVITNEVSGLRSRRSLHIGRLTDTVR